MNPDIGMLVVVVAGLFGGYWLVSVLISFFQRANPDGRQDEQSWKVGQEGQDSEEAASKRAFQEEQRQAEQRKREEEQEAEARSRRQREAEAAERERQKQEEEHRRHEEEEQRKQRERADSSRDTGSAESHHAEVLGLRGKVTWSEIKSRYRELALQYHPDRVHSLGPKLKQVADEEFRKINEAYAFFRERYGK